MIERTEQRDSKSKDAHRAHKQTKERKRERKREKTRERGRESGKSNSADLIRSEIKCGFNPRCWALGGERWRRKGRRKMKGRESPERLGIPQSWGSRAGVGAQAEECTELRSHLFTSWTHWTWPESAALNQLTVVSERFVRLLPSVHTHCSVLPRALLLPPPHTHTQIQITVINCTTKQYLTILYPDGHRSNVLAEDDWWPTSFTHSWDSFVYLTWLNISMMNHAINSSFI